MTTDQALKYVLDEARKLGYTAFTYTETYEIYDRLNRFPNTDKETLDRFVKVWF